MNSLKHLLWPSTSGQLSVLPTRYLSSSRASITRTKRAQYLRSYPTMVVNPDGSTYTIRYHEPRSIIQLPFDLRPFSESEKRVLLERRKPKTRVTETEDTDYVEFDSKKYRKYIKN